MSKWWRAAGGGLRRAIEDPKLRSYHTIQAIPREYTGHRVSVRDRGQGRIPTIVFSQNYVEKKPGDPNSIAAEPSVSRKLFLTTEKRQIKAILNSVELPFFCSTTFPLQIRAGSGSSTLIESGRVLPIKIHRNEETGEILNLVLAWAEDGKKFVVDVPIVFKGEDVCPGIQKGWSLRIVFTYEMCSFVCISISFPLLGLFMCLELVKVVIWMLVCFFCFCLLCTGRRSIY
ncbi:OLC1v1010095C2 [Oldenlandia corymbosa var. corymbosa]|uniref:OLC1v1010095C2 n=1 Tax=Oldenlandia corymbosa var. corymbosa TaxID=529605 RepID=A0AAV1DR16_OLDCO|nr:OLC1v1010095C2 [Oldenlandia corymbosa var. corymbosa]